MKAVVQARIYSSQKTPLERVTPLRTPYSIHIDVCSICNFKCTFCFQKDEAAIAQKKLKRGLMEVSLFDKIVHDLAAFPDKIRKVKIGLHGEPTLHPGLTTMIRHLESHAVTDVIELFTNAALLKPELNVALIDSGVDRINISLEGLTREKYREVTGANVDMDDLQKNIQHLYGIRKECRLYIKLVDIGLTEDDKRKFYEMFGDCCDEIYIEHVVPQWAEIDAGKAGATGMYGQKIPRYKHVCPFLFMYMHFNYDGTVSGCTLDWAREVLIGDVARESAIEIWNGRKLKELQKLHLMKKRKSIPFCDTCQAPMVCCLEDLDDYCEELLKKISS
jgi:radical SAM protein with 4Fe4S-binding SPASM domain